MQGYDTLILCRHSPETCAKGLYLLFQRRPLKSRATELEVETSLRDEQAVDGLQIRRELLEARVEFAQAMTNRGVNQSPELLDFDADTAQLLLAISLDREDRPDFRLSAGFELVAADL